MAEKEMVEALVRRNFVYALARINEGTTPEEALSIDKPLAHPWSEGLDYHAQRAGAWTEDNPMSAYDALNEQYEASHGGRDYEPGDHAAVTFEQTIGVVENDGADSDAEAMAKIAEHAFHEIGLGGGDDTGRRLTYRFLSGARVMTVTIQEQD